MVEFIRQNPATTAYLRAQQEARARSAQDIADATNLQRLEETVAGSPSRLRSLTADASTRETAAGVAQQTAPHQVTVAAEQAARAPIETQTARRQEGEAAATSPDRVTQTKQNTRLGEVRVAGSEMDVFIKSLELAEQGDIPSAKKMAASIGDTIPDEILGNRALIGVTKNLAQRAIERHPNNPRKQEEFVRIGLEEIARQGNGSRALMDPGFTYKVPGAAPADETATGKTGKLQFEVIREAALALGYDAQTAFDLASGQKPPTDVELQNLARQLVTMEMPSSDFRTTPEQRRARFEEIVADLRATQGRAPAQQAQPAASPAASSAMSGSGSQQDPYKATTQSQVDWFKRTAPAGSVIEIDGVLYTK
jgi:hypothetical protein